MPRDERDTPYRIRAAGGAATSQPTSTDAPRPFTINAAGGAAAIQAADGNDADGKPKLGTFKGNAYTGAVMRPEGWWLPIICDLNGFKIPSQHRPVLRQHDHQQIVGHTTSVSASEKDGVPIEGLLSGEKKHTDTVTVPAGNKFQWQLSIGANPIRTEFLEAGESATVNGREVIGPLTIARETELGEISFVPLGADGDTSATVNASASNRRGSMFKAMLKTAKANGNVKAAKYSDETIDKMTDDEAKAALKECMADEEPPAKGKAKAKAADDDEDEDEEDDDEEEKPAKAGKSTRIAARRKEEAREERRIDGIRASAKQYSVSTIKANGREENFVAYAIEQGWSKNKAEVEAMRASRPGEGVGGPHLHFGSRPEITPAVLECAILQAGRHEMRLEDDEFYLDAETKTRRIPAYKQREVQAEFKARYPGQVQQAAHTMFKYRAGLQQILVAAARQNGYRGSDKVDDGNLEEVLRAGMGGSHYGIRASEGASTASIANILANVQNKFALVGYLFVEGSWREFCAIRPTNDFKPTKSVNLLGDTRVKLVPDSGQLEDASLSDQAFANQVDQYGRMLTIGRKPIINDDLSILTTTPIKMGQGAGLGLNNLIYTVFGNLANVNGDDGNAFWNTSGSPATHGAAPAFQKAAGANYFSGAGSALSSAGLQTAKQMYDNQVDPNGNPLGFDAQVPILLYPPELWITAMELVDPSAIGLIYGGASASKQPNVNMWKGRLKPVMSRYLNKTLTDTIGGTKTTVNGSTASWYTLYPAVAGSSVIEVAFLNGVDTPTVQTAGPDWNFDRLGISMRVIFDYGVNQQNFRAGVKAAGS